MRMDSLKIKLGQTNFLSFLNSKISVWQFGECWQTNLIHILLEGNIVLKVKDIMAPLTLIVVRAFPE